LSQSTAAERLKTALISLAAAARDRGRRVTISALCELANVSRNSLYRYHSDVLAELRDIQRKQPIVQPARLQNAINAQQAELALLRMQVPKLVALIDHYYAAFTEAQAILTRRELELAELRRRLDSKPARFAR
jgi:hypothetical protein